MKTLPVLIVFLLSVAVSWAQPQRVVILEFEDMSGMRSDPRLGGSIDPGSLSEKGVYMVGKELANKAGYVLIDRRDFMSQMEQVQLFDSARPTPVRPSFLHAAQALRADAVLRGNLVSFSTGKQVVNQGGFRTEFDTVSVRVALEALDSVDGAVIAVADGVARGQYRQTDAMQTFLSEDDIINLMEEAVSKAVPEITNALQTRMAEREARPTVNVTIRTTADPALVEIDGLLIGTTPIEDFEVYKGDHVLTIGKPGYRDITKRILLEHDTLIEAPMLRTELTADELKEVLDSMRIHAFIGEPGLIIQRIND